MAADVPMRCACGALRGVLASVSPRRGNRVVCYCDDCQAFAHALERADAVLDAQGGTDIFQTSPGRIRIAEGAERLACLRLRPRGLLRWYTECCRTPIGNTPSSARVPFVGLIHGCIDAAATGVPVDELLGSVRARVFVRFARGERARLGPDDRRPPVSQAVRLAGMVLAARLRGDHRRSPFFARDGAPTAPPRVLDPEALRAVEAARDAG